MGVNYHVKSQLSIVSGLKIRSNAYYYTPQNILMCLEPPRIGLIGQKFGENLRT